MNTDDLKKIIDDGFEKINEINVIKLIFSFKKKKPNIAKNKIWSDIIKFVFATVVLYIAKT